MIETSNSQEPVVDAAEGAASAPESSTQEVTQNAEEVTQNAAATPEPKSLQEKVRALAGGKPVASEEGVTPPPPAVDPAAEEKPKYEANLKYKAFGKEKEVPELFKSLVKDPESEKQVKEVFTKADAFDSMKERYENTSKEFQKVSNDFVALDKDVRRVTSFLNNGDLDNFFASVKLSDQQVFDYVQKKLEIMNMPPEQRQAFDRQTQERQQMYELQQQNQYLTQQHQQQAVQARAMQLDQVLYSPQVQSVANAWDQRVGTVGAFRDLVIQEGRLQHTLTGQDAPVEQVVQSVMQKFGKLVDTPQAQPAPQATPANLSQAPAPQAPQGPTTVQQKPVIPVIAGRGTSPVQKRQSLAELQARGRKSRFADDNNF